MEGNKTKRLSPTTMSEFTETMMDAHEELCSLENEKREAALQPLRQKLKACYDKLRADAEYEQVCEEG